MKLLWQFGERMLAWTTIVLLGAVVLIILDLLGYALRLQPQGKQLPDPSPKLSVGRGAA